MERPLQKAIDRIAPHWIPHWTAAAVTTIENQHLHAMNILVLVQMRENTNGIVVLPA